MSASVCLSLVLFAQPLELDDGEPFGGTPSREYATTQRDAMRRRAAEDRVKAAFLRKEEASLLDGLENLDRKIADARKRIDSLDEARTRLEVDVDRADLALQTSHQELTKLRAYLGRRASAMIRLGRRPISDLIGSTRSRVTSRRIRKRLQDVLRYDASLVRDTRAVAARASNIRTELDGRRAGLAQARSDVEAAVDVDALIRHERLPLLEAIGAERSLRDRLAAELNTAAKKLDRASSVIRGILPPPPPHPGSFARQRGRLPWPVAGRVEVGFGKRVDPQSSMVMVHHGLDIRAPYGVPVNAVFDGQVAYVGRVDGFGDVVILDHRGRHYSVYAHLASVDVEEGAEVKRAAPIGTVGDGDSQKGAYLYFGLRRKADAFDPLGWMAP